MDFFGIDILSAGKFVFFLLIIVEGYFLVEILFGEGYFFRKVIEKNNNSLFDRFIHYLVWGILGNLGFLYFQIYNKGIEHIGNFLNISGEFAEKAKIPNVDSFSVQIVVFSCWYFIVFVLITSVFWYALYFGKWIGGGGLSKLFSKILSFICSKNCKEKRAKKKKMK